MVISSALLASLLRSRFSTYFILHILLLYTFRKSGYSIYASYIFRTGFCELLSSLLVNILPHALITGTLLSLRARFLNRQHNNSVGAQQVKIEK